MGNPAGIVAVALVCGLRLEQRLQQGQHLAGVINDAHG
jgi:hypothetical protein